MLLQSLFLQTGNIIAVSPIEVPDFTGALGLLDGPIGTTYSVNVAALNTGGAIEEYELNGTLPAGLTLSTSTGYITGSTTTAATYSGYSVSGTNASGTDTTNTDSVTITASSLEPAYISRFTNYNLDAQGWTDITPTADDSRLIYVDSAVGDDSTGSVYTTASPEVGADPFNPSGSVNYYLTVEAAKANYRSGEKDYVMLRRGQEFVEDVSLEIPTECHLAAFGPTANAMPIYNYHGYGSENDYAIKQSDLSTITDIRFTNSEQNPDHEDFMGWEDMLITNTNAFYFWFGENFAGAIVEGCEIDHLTMGVNLTGQGTTTRAQKLIVRRNNLHHIFGGFSIGVNTVFSETLREQNSYYKVGYYDIYAGTLQSGPQHGSVGVTLTDALTASDVTDITFDEDIPTNIPIGTPIVIETNTSGSPNATNVDGFSGIITPILSFTGRVATVRSSDFSSNNASAGNTAYIRVYGATQYHHSSYSQQVGNSIVRQECHILPASMGEKHISGPINQVNSENVSTTRNLQIGGELGASIGGNGQSTTQARFMNFDYTENISIHLNAAENRNLASGASFRDHQNSTMRRNMALHANATDPIAGLFLGVMQDVVLESQLNYQAGKFSTSQISATVDDYDIKGILSGDSDSSIFVNPNVSIEGFMGEPDTDAGILAFSNVMLDRRKGAWHTRDRDFYNYIKAGMALNDPRPFITKQPPSLTAIDGTDVLLTVGAYSMKDLTYQYKLGGTNMVGETDYKTTFTVSAGMDGNVYTVDVSDDTDTTTSSGATLSVIAARTVPRLSGSDSDDCINFASRVDVAPRERVRFKFRLLTLSGLANVGMFYNSTNGSGQKHLGLSRSEELVDIRNANDISIPNISQVLLDGNLHVVDIYRPDDGERSSVTIDGTVYQSEDVNVTGTDMQIRSLASGDAGSTSSHEIFDVEILDTSGGVRLSWALDSGSSTEEASVGTNTATINFDAGSWFTYGVSAPVVGTLNFPEATQGTAYSYQIPLTGGTPTSRTVETGTLPAWMTVSVTGLATGTPDNSTDATGLSFSFTNDAGTSATSNTDTLIVNSSVPAALTSANQERYWDAQNSGSITASGSSITGWEDLSGSGYDLSANAGTPTTGVEDINGHNAISIGPLDRMDVGGFPLITSNMTVFIVFEPRDIDFSQIFSNRNRGFALNGNAGGQIDYSGTISTADDVFSLSTAYLVTYIVDGADSAIRVNGVEVATGTVNAENFNRDILGGGSESETNGDAIYGAVARYSVALSLSDIQDNEAHLTDRWDIS